MKESVAQRASERGAVLVKIDDLPGEAAKAKGSILTDRQKQWLNTATYDSTTQNPVLYK